jgi:hypothetical protein
MQQKALSHEELLSDIRSLSNPKEQLEELIAVVREMFATIARLTEPNILRLDQVESFITWVKRRFKLKIPGKAIGNTGLGKTYACLACLDEFGVVRRPNQIPEIPVLYIQIDTNACNTAKFFEAILTALKQKATGGTKSQLQQRAWKFLKQCKVRMIIVDEAHCLHYSVLKDVRNLYDDRELGIIPILIGTSSRLDALVEKDEQVRDRFANTFIFEELLGDKFKKTLEIWQKSIIKMQDPLNPNNPKKMFPLLRINDAVVSELEKMAGGELRLLDNILRDAAVRLLEGKLIEINQAVLQALEADGKVLKCNVKKILRETKIDKQLLVSMRGEYLRGQSA